MNIAPLAQGHPAPMALGHPALACGGRSGWGQGATKSRKRLIARSVVRGSDYPQTSITRMCAEWIPAFAGITHSLRRRVAVVGVALDSIYITDRTRMNDAAIIATVRQYFSWRARNVVTAYVFGSVGKGLSGLSSDVDIAVLYALAPIPAVSGPTPSMQAELEALLGRPVDLIVLNQAPVDLVHRVLRDGEVVCETDRRARIEFEVAARRQYLDLLPILRRYRASA